MAQADPKFFQLKIVEMLPEIYSHLNVDKMFVMGDGQQAFSSIAESIIPFLTVLPEITGRSLDFSKIMSSNITEDVKIIPKKSIKKELPKGRRTTTTK